MLKIFCRELLEEREKQISEIKNRGGNEDEEIKKFDMEILKQLDEVRFFKEINSVTVKTQYLIFRFL